MFRLWAVAKHTLRQCLRMKVAVMFIALLGCALVSMPFMEVLKGDGTLAGQIQTFLMYSTTITAALLVLMTIFLSTGILSGDVRTKQIFSVSTKPVAPWQYIIGRWLGIFLLNVLLTALAGSAIYGFAQYLRSGEALATASGKAEDRRKVETEVFAARDRVGPDEKLDIDSAVAKRISAMKEQGRYQEVLQGFIDINKGDREEGYQSLLRELSKQELSKVEPIAAGKTATWSFSGIEAAGRESSAVGTVRGISRQAKAVQIAASPQFVGKLTYDGPVTVNGVDGRTVRIDPDSFVASFSQEDMSRNAIVALSQGEKVDIVADPTIQVTYKASASRRPADGTVASYWEVQNPAENVTFSQSRKDAVNIPATLTVSARAVDADGKTVVRYWNLAEGANTITIRQDDVFVLYRVGEFGPNLVRAMALILAQAAFIGALGVLAGALVSFPVACLFCFSMLPFMVARDFIIDAVVPLAARQRTGWVHYVHHSIVKGINRLLPDFAGTFPGTPLVDGIYISWGFLSESLFWMLCVQSVVLLAVACLIFRKRELARVQV